MLGLACVGGVRSVLAAGAEPKKAGGPNGDEALTMLLEGNRHFAAGTLTHPGRNPADFRSLSAGQSPIVAILGCSDSRVPPEILFDQPIGGIFAVRVAGNYVSGAGAAVKGSVEYAVEELHVPLVVVLGHSQCGAVKAAIAQIHGEEMLPGSIQELVGSIKPAVLEAERHSDDVLAAAVRWNVMRGTERLRTLTPILAPRVKAGTLKIVGMTYDLESGRVTVLG